MLGRAKSPLSDPGSTVPKPKIAAVERRKASRSPLRARPPEPERAEAATDGAPFGALPPRMGGLQEGTSLNGRSGGNRRRKREPMPQRQIRRDDDEDAQSLVRSLFLVYGAAVIPPGTP